MNLLKKYSINIYELNVILIMIGFQLFSFILTGHSGSIIYRAGALALAILCIVCSKSKVPRIKDLKYYLVFLGIFIVRTLYDLYLGEWSDTIFTGPRTQCALYAVGIVFIPVYAFCKTYDRIRWDRCIVALFILTILMLMYSLRSLDDSAVTNDGRYNVGKIVSIVFGDLGGYLLIMTCSLWSFYKKRLFIPIYLLGIIISVLVIAKAGSRGPLVSTIFALSFFYVRLPKRSKFITLVAIIIAVSLAGAALYSYFYELAPVLFERMTDTVVAGDTGNRDLLFEEALTKFLSSPILGDCWVTLEPLEFSSYHNVYVDTFVGLGIFGGLYLVILMLNKVYGIWKLRQTPLPIECLFMFSLLLYNCMRGITGIMLVQNSIFSFALLGVIIVMHNKSWQYTNV